MLTICQQQWCVLTESRGGGECGSLGGFALEVLTFDQQQWWRLHEHDDQGVIKCKASHTVLDCH